MKKGNNEKNVAKNTATGRRGFLKKAVAGLCTTAAAAATGSFAAPAIAKGLREWKLVMTWQKVLPGLGTGTVRLARRITRLTEGKIKVKVYGGGELVPPQGVFDAVSDGIAELGHSAAYYWQNKARAAAFFCAVPGGLTLQEQNGWIYFGGGQRLWDELYAEFGLRAFPAGNTGVQMGGWFKKPINSLEDIKGLKMRIPGLGGEVFNRMGGSAQTIPPQELFTAIQSGVIDGLEWVGAWNDMALGFHRVANYYYGPAFQEGGPMLEMLVNKKAFESLPKDLQIAVRCACATENDLMTAQYHANNIQAFHTLKHEHKVDIRRYPEDVLNAFFKTSEQVVAEVADDSEIARKIYQSYSNYRKLSIQQEDKTERTYLNARALTSNG